MKVGWWQTRAFQDYQVLAIIVRQAFGSSKDDARVPDSKEEAKAIIDGMFKRG